MKEAAECHGEIPAVSATTPDFRRLDRLIYGKVGGIITNESSRFSQLILRGRISDIRRMWLDVLVRR